MSENFEQSLRRAMEFLGGLVESVIGKAKKAKVQVGSRSGVQPILSLESQLSSQRIRDLIDASIQRMISTNLPDIRGGKAIEIGEGPVLFGSRLLSSQASIAVGVEIGGGSAGRQGDISRGYVVRSRVDRLPFGDSTFSYLLARMATPFQGDMVRAVREMGRVLTPGGQGVIIDFHPYGLFAKRGGVRLRPAESGIRKFEDFYLVCKKGGVRVVDIKEAVVDEEMRSFFHEDEIQAYRNLKGTPLLAFLFVYKPKGRS
jgi:SAM-dependent methyltransferase